MVEKKKNENGDDDFIGWKSPDGKLEVIGIIYFFIIYIFRRSS